MTISIYICSKEFEIFYFYVILQIILNNYVILLITIIIKYIKKYIIFMHINGEVGLKTCKNYLGCDI